jgi:hypothetical protein
MQLCLISNLAAVAPSEAPQCPMRERFWFDATAGTLMSPGKR